MCINRSGRNSYNIPKRIANTISVTKSFRNLDRAQQYNCEKLETIKQLSNS